MAIIGGLCPEIIILVDVLTKDGGEQAACSLCNIPFAGDWNKETGDVNVGCLWDRQSLEDNLAVAQDWGLNVIIVCDLEEQLSKINQALNNMVMEDPLEWTD